MAESNLEQMIETFAEHKHLYNPRTVTPKEKAFIINAYKDAILSDVRDELIQRMKKEVQKEAKSYKRSLFQRVRTNIIIDTIFIAFLVGLIINQVTYLIPQSILWAGGVIIISLLLCILFIFLKPGKG